MKVSPLFKFKLLWAGLMVAFVSSSLSAAQFGLFTYEVVDGSSIAITGYPRSATGSVVIPEELEGKPVTSIGNSAFWGCENLTEISIPNSVKYIGDFAFYTCYSLTNIHISSNVETIGNSAFAYCNRVTDVYLAEGVISIGSSAFSNCTELKSCDIPNSVTTLGFSAFAYCTSMSHVTISNNLSSINSGVFNHCSSLETIQIPSSILSIGSTAFSYCSNLASIIIPKNVTSIGRYAFYVCTSLEKVIVSGDVATIGDYAFRNCSSLAATYFLGDAPVFGSSVYLHGDPNHVIYYFDTSAGFTSPTWNGYPTQSIDTEEYSFAAWLLKANMAYDTNINQDLNGDGVMLLMAYALGLNPNDRLTNQIPEAEVGSTTLELKYYGGSAGVTYRAETSKDMVTWVATGVTISGPDSEGVLTASIPKGGECGFLRLVVVED